MLLAAPSDTSVARGVAKSPRRVRPASACLHRAGLARYAHSHNSSGRWLPAHAPGVRGASCVRRAAMQAVGPDADEATGTAASSSLELEFDNSQSEDQTVITITGQNEPGLLLTTTTVFSALDITVADATISTTDDGRVLDVFRVCRGGKRIPEAEFPEIQKNILQVVSRSNKSSKPAIYGAIAAAEAQRLTVNGVSDVSEDATASLELAAAELAAAAAQLVSVEREIMQRGAGVDGKNGTVPDQRERLANDRVEAAAVLERKMAAMEALMAARKGAVGTKAAEPEKARGGGAEYRFAQGGGTSTGPAAGTGYEIILQAFNWESHRGGWYQRLKGQVQEWADEGVLAIWMPPPTDSVSPQGYLPRDLYCLDSNYGSEADLRDLLREMKERKLIRIADIVINHRCAHFQDGQGRWNRFGGRLSWDASSICSNNAAFGGSGAWKRQDDYPAAPNIDHSQERIRKDIGQWLEHLKKVGFDGWRFDYVKGYEGKWSREYVDRSMPEMAFGEFWDTMAYTDSVLDYNQNAHRQRTIDWCDATGGTCAAFDFTTKGILQEAIAKVEYWRLVDPEGRPPGVVGMWPSRAVTFLENHDTGSTLGHWPFPRQGLQEGYAYILTHPGTPCIFYDHYYGDDKLRQAIRELIRVRRDLNLHARSKVFIRAARADVYAATIDERCAMKIGPGDWSPNHALKDEGGNWRLRSSGHNYAVWVLER